MPTDDLVTMSESEYAAYLRDERPDEWQSPSTIPAIPRMISTEERAALTAMGFLDWSDIPF